MASPPNSLNLLSSLFLLLIITSSALPKSYALPPPSDFIRKSCSATTFPAQCIQSLGFYASMVQRSPVRLAHAALTLSLTRSKTAADFMNKLANSQPPAAGVRLSLREKGAVKDCIATLSDSSYRLGQSIDELKKLGRNGQFRWHMSNVQTWVSGALSNQYSCLNGFGGYGMSRSSRVRAMVRREVMGVTQVTSNALAIVNKLAGQKM